MNFMVGKIMRVRIFKHLEYPNILRQLPGFNPETNQVSGHFDDIEFIFQEDGECDFTIVLNRVGKNNRQVTCPPSNIWAVFQEPFIFKLFDWMIDNHQKYQKIFTHHIFNKNNKYIPSYPMLPWYVDKTYDELTAMTTPEKSQDISWITSNKSDFPGHKERVKFLDIVQKSELNIDIFGNGICPIDDKWDGLAPYKYCLVVENSSSKDYWTEKISDCFLSFSLPIYYGCTNIDQYFPTDSYIRIDINKPEQAIAIIQGAIQNNEWEKRKQDILKARGLVLNKYNFFHYITPLLKEAYKPELNKKRITLKPFSRSYKRRFLNKIEKLKR